MAHRVRTTTAEEEQQGLVMGVIIAGKISIPGSTFGAILTSTAWYHLQ
jgi:hypothetical protein